MNQINIQARGFINAVDLMRAYTTDSVQPISADERKYIESNIVEIGYIIYTPDGMPVREFSSIIAPDQFVITNSQIHGISHDSAVTDGISIIDMFKRLCGDIAECDIIVAHNMDFDYNVLMAEFYRYNAAGLIDCFSKLAKICTMQMGMQKLHLKYRPKLISLYSTLSKQKLDKQTHRALEDAKLAASCYRYLKYL